MMNKLLLYIAFPFLGILWILGAAVFGKMLFGRIAPEYADLLAGFAALIVFHFEFNTYRTFLAQMRLYGSQKNR